MECSGNKAVVFGLAGGGTLEAIETPYGECIPPRDEEDCNDSEEKFELDADPLIPLSVLFAMNFGKLDLPREVGMEY